LTRWQSAALGLLASLYLGVLDRTATGQGAQPAGPGAVLQQLVSSGQASPVGGSFDRFELAGQAIPAPSNGHGEVAFFSTLVRSEADEGLFLVAGDRLGKIAVVGDIVPTGERVTDFTDRPSIALNDAGAAAFVAALAGGRATSGVFVAANGFIDAAAVSGATVSDIPTGTLTSFEGPAVDDAGGVAFLASVRRGRTLSDAILIRRDGVLRKIAAAGDDAPDGGVFAGFGAPAISRRGQVAFAAILEQGSALGGIYVFARERVKLAIAVGSPAPGGGIFAKFSEQVAINDDGAIAFSAGLRQGGPQSAIFLAEDGHARAVAAIGDSAPGGGVFAAFPSPPVLSQTGDIAFVAAVDGGSTPLGIYRARPHMIERLAGLGDIPPQGPKITAFPRYPAISISPDGALTFVATTEHDRRAKDALFYLGKPRQARH